MTNVSSNGPDRADEKGEPNRAGTVLIECPVLGCGWQVDATPPEVDSSAVAAVFGVGTLQATSMYQHQHRIEDELNRHLTGHTVLEFVRSIESARGARERLDDAVHDVIQDLERYVAVGNDVTPADHVAQYASMRLREALDQADGR